MADLPRAPSRIGFMRPPLRRQDNSLRLESHQFEETYEEDEEWDGEYSGDLMYPPGGHSSDHAEDFGELEPPPLLKPSLPSQSISIACVPIRLLSHSSTSLTDPSMAIPEEDGHVMHLIPDHGLSRSALTHLKEFWGTRKIEWTRKQAALARTPPTMYGMAQFARESLRDTLFGRLTSSPTRAEPPVEAKPAADVTLSVVNIPIYPRTGDLMRLRDVRFATMDRAFCNIPLYSIAKMLFLHDMLDRSGASTPSSRSQSPVGVSEELKAECDGEDVEGCFVDVSLSSSHSGSAGSEDETLVEQDSVSEATSARAAKLSTVDDGENSREWEVDWSARWRMLLHTTRTTISSSPHPFTNTLPAIDEDALIEALHSVSASPDIPPRSDSRNSMVSPTRARFFIPEEEDEDDYFNSYDADGDDEEDYGRLLRRTIYDSEPDNFPRTLLTCG